MFELADTGTELPSEYEYSPGAGFVVPPFPGAGAPVADDRVRLKIGLFVI